MKKKMDLTKDSPEIAQEKLESFKKLFPEAISEGKIDVEALRRTIGESVAAVISLKASGRPKRNNEKNKYLGAGL